jgi:hypothetical protein
VRSHGIKAKDAVEIVGAVEIGEHVDQGEKEDTDSERLRGANASGSFQIEEDESDAQKNKSERGREGETCGILHACGVEGKTGKESLETKIVTSGKFNGVGDTD